MKINKQTNDKCVNVDSITSNDIINDYIKMTGRKGSAFSLTKEAGCNSLMFSQENLSSYITPNMSQKSFHSKNIEKNSSFEKIAKNLFDMSIKKTNDINKSRDNSKKVFNTEVKSKNKNSKFTLNNINSYDKSSNRDFSTRANSSYGDKSNVQGVISGLNQKIESIEGEKKVIYIFTL